MASVNDNTTGYDFGTTENVTSPKVKEAIEKMVVDESRVNYTPRSTAQLASETLTLSDVGKRFFWDGDQGARLGVVNESGTAKYRYADLVFTNISEGDSAYTQMLAWFAAIGTLVAAGQLVSVEGSLFRHNGSAMAAVGVVNSFAFGAVGGDGSVDDHAALQAAVNWYKAADGRYLDLLPSGNIFLTESTIELEFGAEGTSGEATKPGEIFGSGGILKSGISGVAGSGTIEIVNNAVTGTGTLFTTEVKYGDSIFVNGNDWIVDVDTGDPYGNPSNDLAATVFQEINAGVNEPAGSSYTVWKPALRVKASKYIQRMLMDSLRLLGQASVTGGCLVWMGGVYHSGSANPSANFSSGDLGKLQATSVYNTAIAICRGAFEIDLGYWDLEGPTGGDRVLVRLLPSASDPGSVSSVHGGNLNLRGGLNALRSRVRDFKVDKGTCLLTKEAGVRLDNFSGSLENWHAENTWQKYNRAITACAAVANVAITAFADAGDAAHVIVQAVGHDCYDGDTVTITSVSGDFDGTFTVSSADRTAGTYEIDLVWPATATTTGTYTVDMIEITLADHGLTGGEDVAIQAVTGAVYDGDYTVANVPDTDTLRVPGTYTTNPADGELFVYGCAGILCTGSTVSCSFDNLRATSNSGGQAHGIRAYGGSGDINIGACNLSSGISMGYLQTANDHAVHWHNPESFTKANASTRVFVYGSARLTAPAIGKERDYNGGTAASITPVRDEGEIIDINPNVAQVGTGYTINAPTWQTTPQTGDCIQFQFRSTQGNGPFPINFASGAYSLCNGALTLESNTTLAIVRFEYTSNGKWQEVFRAVHPANGRLTTKVLIPTADVLQLNTTPYELLAAPGAGLYREIHEIRAFLSYNSVAYTGANNVEFRYTDGAGAKVSDDLPVANLNAAADQMVRLAGASPVLMVANAPLVASVPTADPGAGDSNLIVFITHTTRSEVS